MLEHNRNLSSIIGTIQDEGPPGEPAESTTGPDVTGNSTTAGAGIPDPVGTGHRQSSLRPLLYLLLAALIMAAAFIFILGGRDGSSGQEAVPFGVDRSAVPAVTAGQNDAPDNDEILVRQSLILEQLEELKAALADIEANNDRYRIDGQKELKNLQADFQREIDGVSAAVAALQERDSLLDQGQGPPAMSLDVDNSAALKSSASNQPEKEESPASPAGDPDGQVVTGKEPDTARVGGTWVVNVVSSEHLGPVEKLMGRLHEHGIPAEVQKAIVDGKVRYRLRIPGFSTGDEARVYAHNLDDSLGLKDPWVSKR